MSFFCAFPPLTTTASDHFQRTPTFKLSKGIERIILCFCSLFFQRLKCDILLRNWFSYSLWRKVESGVLCASLPRMSNRQIHSTYRWMCLQSSVLSSFCVVAGSVFPMEIQNRPKIEGARLLRGFSTHSASCFPCHDPISSSFLLFIFSIFLK